MTMMYEKQIFWNKSKTYSKDELSQCFPCGRSTEINTKPPPTPFRPLPEQAAGWKQPRWIRLACEAQMEGDVWGFYSVVGKLLLLRRWEVAAAPSPGSCPALWCGSGDEPRPQGSFVTSLHVVSLNKGRWQWRREAWRLTSDGQPRRGKGGGGDGR